MHGLKGETRRKPAAELAIGSAGQPQIPTARNPTNGMSSRKSEWRAIHRHAEQISRERKFDIQEFLRSGRFSLIVGRQPVPEGPRTEK
jgi:hypothetical protein